MNPTNLGSEPVGGLSERPGQLSTWRYNRCERAAPQATGFFLKMPSWRTSAPSRIRLSGLLQKFIPPQVDRTKPAAAMIQGRRAGDAGQKVNLADSARQGA